MSLFATVAEPITDPVTEPEPQTPEPELDPSLGEELGDEIVLATVRKQRVARTHGPISAETRGAHNPRAWQAAGGHARVD